MSKPVALIPLNDLSRAKGRLSALLTPEQRIGLANATFATAAIAAERAGFRVVVLAANPGDVAGFEGAEVVAERADLSGLNPQLEAAVSELECDELLILHADLPLASGPELRRVVEGAAAAPSATMVRSRDGGTNVMLLRPPRTFALHYGPNSFAAHADAATKAGVALTEVVSEALALDLDTPEDIDAFLAMPASMRSPVGMILRQILASRS